MATQVQFEAPTWSKIYQLLLNQAAQIQKSNFKPDVIVGVSRGGWLPARVLSDLLENLNLASVKAENYVGIGKTLAKPVLTQSVSTCVKGKRVLLVDEVADSGGSLKLVKDHLLSEGAAEVKVATLYFKPKSAFKPDYYEEETLCWLVFPWDLKETLRKIWEATRKSDTKLKEQSAKLEAAGVSAELITRFLKEFSEGQAC